MRVITISLSLLMSICFAPSAVANEFTAATVGKFIESLKSMNSISQKYGEPDQLGDISSLSEGLDKIQTPFSSAVTSLEGYAGYDEIQQVIAANGFSDISQWALFGDRVMQAYGALMVTDQQPEINAQMAQAMQELEGSGMSEAQKKMIADMMQSAGQVVSKFQDVPESDKAAVRPHLSALENLD